MGKKQINSRFILFLLIALCSFSAINDPSWESVFVKINSNRLQYTPDGSGNIIPDFSRVGYQHGNTGIPDIRVVREVEPGVDDRATIQEAIDAVAKLAPDKNGFRGAILLEKGLYQVNGTVNIRTSGIVLRGKGDKTILKATGNTRDPVINVSGTGNRKEEQGTTTHITDEFVPVGSFSFNVDRSSHLRTGDRIMIRRKGTAEWIHDLKMDQIEDRGGTRQWQPAEYDLEFERQITKVEGNKVFIDNPVMMQMEKKYGGGEIFRYSFEGRIENVGIENIFFESKFTSDTAEDHSWDAIMFNKIENGWIRNVTARYFAFSCVNLGSQAKNISVLNSNCFEPKSVITGSRRYSFNNNGQQNLFKNCNTTEGRHDFVTGARVCGPNVFVYCTAKSTHADIGPHHRWAVGTLYDNIITDGDINVQDRGNWGSGHGWAGVTQVLWNCTVRRATVQNPWASGKNYSIGLKGEKTEGRLKGRPDGVWEGLNKPGLTPESLYEAQLKERKRKS